MKLPANDFIRLRRIIGVTGTMLLAAVMTSSAQQLTVTPFHKSGIYDLGEKAGWNVSLPAGATPPANNYTYTIKQNSQVVIKSGELDLSSGKTTIETSLNEPAMLYMQITPPAGAAGQGGGGGFRRGGGGRGGNTYGAAVAPTKLQPSAPCPDDFDAFWKGKLDELAKVPINPVLTSNATTNAGVEFYTVTLDSLNSHVHGYLAKPAKPGKFPAMVYYQYAGVYALDKTISLNRAAQGWLVFNVDSHDQAPDKGSSPALGNYASQGNTNRETSYFLNMYLRDKRAVDYVASRPDWNGKVLVAMGISMGGQQSLVTAGLDPRITHAIVWVPSGADFDGPLHGHASGHPNWSGSNPLAMEAGLYFDTVNFAPRIKATTFIAMGFRDTIASPVGIWTAFDQIKAPKEIAPMPEAAHNNQASPEIEHMWYDGSEKWLGELVKGEKVKPDPTTVNP